MDGTRILNDPSADEAAKTLRRLADSIEIGDILIKRLAIYQGGEIGFDMTITGHAKTQERIG